MKNIKQSDTRQLSFDEAVEGFKGYPCFSHIPLELFDEVVRVASNEGKTPQLVRGRIAQVIWKDEVENSLSHLDYLERKEVAEHIRDAVNEKVEQYWPQESTTALELVQSAG